MKYLVACIFTLLFLVSCTTDFPRKEIATTNLNGFIEGGNAAGVYGKARLKITEDSIKMNDWPVSRLVNSLNILRDTTLEDLTKVTDVYTIQIANIGELEAGEFCDSLIVELSKAGLAR